jgi:hypothetical protein
MWNGFIWLRTGTDGGIYEHVNGTLRSSTDIKGRVSVFENRMLRSIFGSKRDE